MLVGLVPFPDLLLLLDFSVNMGERGICRQSKFFAFCLVLVSVLVLVTDYNLSPAEVS